MLVNKKNAKLIDGLSQRDWTELSPLVGSRQEFDSLVERHYAWMLSGARGNCPPDWRVSSPHVAGFTASDVLHDVIARLANKWYHVPAEPGFRPYVSRCVRMQISDIMKQNTHRKKLTAIHAHDYNSSACVSERINHDE